MRSDKAMIAGALNLFTWGGGYLYLGERTHAALGLVAAWIMAVAWAAPRWLAGDATVLADAALVTVGAALAYDAYAHEAHHGDAAHDEDAAAQ